MHRKMGPPRRMGIRIRDRECFSLKHQFVKLLGGRIVQLESAVAKTPYETSIVAAAERRQF